MQGRCSKRALHHARLPVAGLACLLGAFALPAPNAGAAPSGALSMNPSNNAIEVGDTVTITLDLSGAVDIHEIHVAVSYNASVLQAVDYDAGQPGVQVLPGPFPGTDAEGTVLENLVSGGIINYQYELHGINEISGSGTLATVQFVALAEGSGNLAWSVRTLRDGNGVSTTPSAATAVIVVGNTAPPPTNTPEPTSTPAPPTSTPVATNTSAPTSTPVSSPTGAPTQGAVTPVSTVPIASVTRTLQSTPTPAVTATPRATVTPRITVIEDSNRPRANPPASSILPSQSDRAEGLPQAGTEGPAIAWWKWTFFAAALMLGVAGWFFTFAVHHADREVVLMDRFDAKRQKYSRRLPKR
jgi:hypothetical protein